LAALSSDPEMQTNIVEGGGLLEIITAENHRKLQGALLGLVIASLGLLGLIIFFSYRFGRLGSPGCVIFVTALPGIILLPLSTAISATSGEPLPLGEDGGFAMFAQIAVDALPGVASILTRTYLIFLGIGLLLMLLALLGNIFIREKK
jgi:hypothetical protein